MRENNKRTIPAPLRKMLEQANKENWSRETGRGFTEEEIVRVAGNNVYISMGDSGITSYVYKIDEMNRRELETVRDWILAGNKFKRHKQSPKNYDPGVSWHN